jgi:hypothetical protein
MLILPRATETDDRIMGKFGSSKKWTYFTHGWLRYLLNHVI